MPSRVNSTAFRIELTNLEARKRRQRGLTKRKAPYVPDDPLLTAAEAALESGRALSTFWRDIKAELLPAPIYVTPRSPRWRRSEVRAAVEACRRAGRGNSLMHPLPSATPEQLEPPQRPAAAPPGVRRLVRRRARGNAL